MTRNEQTRQGAQNNADRVHTIGLCMIVKIEAQVEAARLKLLPTNEPANQHHEGSGSEEIEERANGTRTQTQPRKDRDVS
jgi:hypothetical protein